MLIDEIQKLTKNNPNQLYGVLIFTEDHPEIIKVLDDSAYFNSIDRRSGKWLDIFVTKLRSNKNSQSDTLMYLTEVAAYPEENRELMNVFQINDDKELPQFVIFGEDKKSNSEFSFYFKSKIDTKSVEETYKSIEEVIEMVTNTVRALEEKGEYTQRQLRQVLSINFKLYNAKVGIKKILFLVPPISKMFF